MQDNYDALSICIPVYNSEKTIDKTLDSILNQTILPDEVILIDDGSTDSTYSLITNFIKNDVINVMVYSQENHGQAFTRNKLIHLSKYEFIVFLDSDDLIHPQFVEFFKYAIRNYNFDFCFSKYLLLSQTDTSRLNIKNYKLGSISKNLLELDYNETHKNYVLGKVKIAPTTILLRKSHLVANDIFFNPKIRYGEDDIFILDLFSKSFKAIKLNYSLYFYVRRNDSITSRPVFDDVISYNSLLKLIYSKIKIDNVSSEILANGYSKRFVGLVRMFAKYDDDFDLYKKLLTESDLRIKNFLNSNDFILMLYGMSMILMPKFTFYISKYLPG